MSKFNVFNMLAISLLLGFEWKSAHAISHIFAKKSLQLYSSKIFDSDNYKHGKTQNFRLVLI